jgi:hypothetical protein
MGCPLRGGTTSLLNALLNRGQALDFSCPAIGNKVAAAIRAHGTTSPRSKGGEVMAGSPLSLSEFQDTVASLARTPTLLASRI